VLALLAGALIAAIRIASTRERPRISSTRSPRAPGAHPLRRARRAGAQRWLGWGPVKIQPSELAKVATVILLATQLSDRKKDWTQDPEISSGRCSPP